MRRASDQKKVYEMEPPIDFGHQLTRKRSKSLVTKMRAIAR